MTIGEGRSWGLEGLGYQEDVTCGLVALVLIWTEYKGKILNYIKPP